MTAFDDLFRARPVPPPPGRDPPYEQPSWLGPPADELGAPVPATAVLGRSQRAAVALRRVTSFSTGVTFELVALARGLRPSEANRVMHEQHVVDPEEGPSPLFLRFGVELADGRRASSVGDMRALFGSSEPPAGPVLSPAMGGGGMVGGAGGDVSLQPGFWLWPLPPGDELRLFCEWPGLDLALSEHVLDAAAIREAAARSVRLWDAPDG